MNWLSKNLDSRRVFIQTLEELDDPKNIIVTSDVGMNYLTDTKLKVFNFGVTEQSSVIISASLALSGYIVWFYSMINFVVFRPYEMVRNAICMHNANVKLLGVKGSEAYKFLGFSHNLLHDREDKKVLSNLPNLKIHIPKSLQGVRETVIQESRRNGPC